MSFFDNMRQFFGADEYKSGGELVPRHSTEDIEARVEAAQSGGDAFTLSVVMACARVIAEGLALPPCYVHRVGPTGATLARDHALYPLLNGAPNSRQTSYEFREQMGLHLASKGNFYVWINRLRSGEVFELVPCEAGTVQVTVDESRLNAPVTYTIAGRPIPNNQMWHIKGPSWFSYMGMDTRVNASTAIGLASAMEKFGASLFRNGARPGGILSPTEGKLLQEQQAQLAAEWNAQNRGAANANKTAFLSGAVKYEPLGSTANEAQFIEARRFQIEEICRYFRVSPTKVFHTLGSQSYASVEQAHIAHDQDTDAHWHARFVQSANKALLTDRDRAEGIQITIDNRDYLRGTAMERMQYYQLGIAAGIITRNEAREMEGFDRSTDAGADQLTPAANLFGNDAPDDAPTE